MTDEVSALLAQRRYREASQWWAMFDVAVHRYRCWAVVYLSRKQIHRKFGHRRGAWLREQIDQAHDRMLIECENIWTAARCAVSAEIAGRIYDEEHEGREHGLV